MIKTEGPWIPDARPLRDSQAVAVKKPGTTSSVFIGVTSTGEYVLRDYSMLPEDDDAPFLNQKFDTLEAAKLAYELHP